MTSLTNWFIGAAQITGVIINMIACLCVVCGVGRAVHDIGRMVIRHDSSERRAVWLRCARWLVAGLTFQLAADIIATSTSATWESIVRLGIIAVLRTFMDYFIERDIEDLRARG